MRISIQGEKGSFSYLAAQNLNSEEIEFLYRDSFKEVFKDLLENHADKIVIPIENSTYGSIFQNYDLLTKHNFNISSEVYLKINFHLIVNKGVSKSEITELYTHPVALGQIQNFLAENPQLKAIEYPDTSGAVQMIKEKNLKNASAAASRAAAKLYDMDILEENIQDNLKNYTRFFEIEKNNISVKNEENNKTTIEFELGEEVGSLYKVLEFFKKRKIALTKIESRPIINTEWEYTFYIDFLNGYSKIKPYISELKYLVKKFRILGSYKKGSYINT